MLAMRIFFLFISLSIVLLGCGERSFLTSDLTHKDAYASLIGQKISLLSGDKVWCLMRDPYDPLTNFSDGYKLTLMTSDHAADITSGRIKPPFTPQGFYEILGIVDGSQIQIERVHEYGMETAVPVALGYIELNNGHRYPFESEWLPTYKSQITIKEAENK